MIYIAGSQKGNVAKVSSNVFASFCKWGGPQK